MGNGLDKTTNRFVLIVRVFLPFATGYFLSNLFRVINAVIASDLEKDLAITAADLGLLSSAYFLAFACFQLPLGVMLDRYGPRRVVAGMLIVTSIGSIIFAQGNNLFELTSGRALIGLGLSGCLMASFKAFSQCFEKRKLPAINGYLMACGGLGAISATVPVDTVLELVSWRNLFMILAFITAMTSLFVWHCVPEVNYRVPGESFKRQMVTVGRIMASKSFRVVIPVALFSHGFGVAVISLWSALWLRDVAEFDRATSAHAMLLLMLAMTVGYPIWGMIAVRLAKSGITLTTVATTGCFLFMLMNIVICLQPTKGQIYIWMAYGFALSSCSLFYATLASAYQNDMSGRVNTALNLMVFISAFIFQWGLGLIIENWTIYAHSDIAQGYQVAFGLSVVLQFISLLWLYFGRDYLKEIQ